MQQSVLLRKPTAAPGFPACQPFRLRVPQIWPTPYPLLFRTNPPCKSARRVNEDVSVCKKKDNTNSDNGSHACSPNDAEQLPNRCKGPKRGSDNHKRAVFWDNIDVIGAGSENRNPKRHFEIS
jgi:hypothetical protein